MKRFLPILDWLPGYQRSWLRPDLLAGLTAAAVVIPKTMAIAVIAGAPVEVGLYTALVPMLIYALLGTSRPLSMSTTTTIGMLTGAALARLQAEDPATLAAAAASLGCMVGAALLVASLLRLGSLSNLISEPVLIGFKFGLGLAIVADQLPKLMGIHFQKTGFFRNLLQVVKHSPETSLWALGTGLGTLALILALKRFFPRLPGPLVAVAGGIAASWLLNLSGHGVEIVGHIPPGLPGFRMPDLRMFDELWPAAVGIALMSFTESVASARAFAGKGDPQPDANQELRALGLANLAGGMFHSMPAGGGTSQTAVNSRAGARTQVSELVTVAVTLLVVLFLSPLISLLPQPVLAAVLIAACEDLLKVREMREILRIRRMEFSWAIWAIVGVVLLGTLKGILVAVVISLAALVLEAHRCRVYALGRKPGTDIFRRLSPEYPDDETFPGLLLLRTEGRIYFANAPTIVEKMRALTHEGKPKVLVLDCSAVSDIEYSALKMLAACRENARREHVDLWLAALNPEVLAMVRRSPLGEALGRERMCFDVAQAVRRFQALGAQPAEA